MKILGRGATNPSPLETICLAKSLNYEGLIALKMSNHTHKQLLSYACLITTELHMYLHNATHSTNQGVHKIPVLKYKTRIQKQMHAEAWVINPATEWILSHSVIDNNYQKEEDSDDVDKTNDEKESNMEDAIIESGSGESEAYDSEGMDDTSGSGN